MYITQPVQREIKADCPPSCEQPIHIYFNLLGILFGLACLALFLLKKKKYSHVRAPQKKLTATVLAIASLTFLILFSLYFVKVEYRPAAPGCPSGGAYVNGRLWFDPLTPLYSTRP